MDLESRVRWRLADVSRLMATHAGGLELVAIDGDGAVTVSFTGMCSGCQLRPLTMAGTIRPGLLALEGVTSVRATGSRISDEAEERLSAALASNPNASLRWLDRDPDRGPTDA